MSNVNLNKSVGLNNQQKFKMAAVKVNFVHVFRLLTSMFLGLKMTTRTTDVCLCLYNFIDGMQTKIQIGQ